MTRLPVPQKAISSTTSILLFMILFILSSTQTVAAAGDNFLVEHGEDPDTGLKFWQWDNDGFLLRLTQRLPDQTRAYFEARGFDQGSAEVAATSCLFQTMIKNTGTDSGVTVNAELSDWIVVSGGSRKSMLLRESWRKLWLERKQPQPARVAFEWSLIPDEIQYDVNDYNWGMSSYGLPPGSQFDLLFSWTSAGKQFSGKITDIVCADDIHPEPPSQ